MSYFIDHPEGFVTLASAVFVLFFFMAEVMLSLLLRLNIYDLKDTVANLMMYSGFMVINSFWLPFVFAIYSWIHQIALFDLGHQWWLFQGTTPLWQWVILFFADDLCFYLFHRTSHKVRFLWASHVSHHSSRNFNLSVGLRQTWIPFFAMFFWVPLILIGFDPLMVLTMQLLSLTFQALLHTQIIKSYGPLDIFLNSPSHHRVHHGTQPHYVDRNFGGILILWDRLFGTFEKEDAKPIFGIGLPTSQNNPKEIVLFEWKKIFREMRAHD